MPRVVGYTRSRGVRVKIIRDERFYPKPPVALPPAPVDIDRDPVFIPPPPKRRVPLPPPPRTEFPPISTRPKGAPPLSLKDKTPRGARAPVRAGRVEAPKRERAVTKRFSASPADTSFTVVARARARGR